MKRFTAYILILLSTIALVSCEAVEDRLDIGGFISADQLDIKATPVVVDGKATNKIILNNSSPVLSSWDFGTGKTQKKTDTVLMVVLGENTIIFTGRNPDGSEISKSLTVNVEDMRFPVPSEWGFLTAGSDKEWGWDDGAPSVWGNGGYLGNAEPAWWTLPIADINGQSPNEGAGAKMIFSLRGAQFTKVKSDGTTETGTFSFNMNNKTMDESGAVWAKGKLTLKGTTVLNGISPNEGGAKVYEYDILALDDNRLVLAYPEPGVGAWGTAWFWVFKAID
jgi:hypothetical protein